MKVKVVNIRDNTMVFEDREYKIDYAELYVNNEFFGFIHHATLAIRDFEVVTYSNGTTVATLHI